MTSATIKLSIKLPPGFNLLLINGHIINRKTSVKTRGHDFKFAFERCGGSLQLLDNYCEVEIWKYNFGAITA